MKMSLDERPHIGFDLPRILFAPNHTNQEIISITDINNPSVFRIHRVAVRDRAQSAIKFLYLRHDLPAFFLTDFCFIAFQPFLFSAPDIQRLFVGRGNFPFCTAVKGFGILCHKYVQFIEVDIRQNWANQRPLRGAGIGVVILPIFHISRFQEFPDQADEMLIRNAPAQYLHQHMMVNVVKTSFDITLNKPFDPRVVPLDILQGRMTAPLWAESMGSNVKGRFINAFQYHAHHLLHQLVVEGRNTKRTCFSVCFWDIRSSGRFWLITEILQFLNEDFNSLHTHAIDCFPIASGCHVAGFCLDTLIRQQIKCRIVQVPIEPLIVVIFACCF